MEYQNSSKGKATQSTEGLEAILPPTFSAETVQQGSENGYCQWEAILGGCGKGNCKTSRIYTKK